MPGKAIDSSASGCLVIIFPMALLIAFLFVAWPVLLALVVLGASLRIWQQYQWQKWSQQVNPFFHKLIQENQGRVTAMDLAMKANLSGAAAQRYLNAKVEEFGAIAKEYEDLGTVYYFITASTLGSIFDESEPPSLRDSEPSTAWRKEVSDELEESSSTQHSQPDIAGELRADNVEAEVPVAIDSEPPAESPLDLNSTDNVEAEVPVAIDFEPPAESPPDLNTTDKQTPSQGIIQSELARRLDVHSSTIHKRKSDSDFSRWSQSRDPEGIAWKYSSKTRLFFPLLTKPQEES